MPIHFDEEKQQHKLKELLAEEAEELARSLSARHGLPYVDLSRVSINTDALRLLPEELAREAKVAAFAVTGKNLSVVILTPNNAKTQMALKGLEGQGYNLTVYLGTEPSLTRAWERYGEVSTAFETKAGQIDVANDQIKFFLEKTEDLGDIKGFIGSAISEPGRTRTSAILEIIIAGALATEASDIHIEPEEAAVRLRFRLDGVLNEVADFTHPIYNLLLSRIKLISALKLNIKSARQDGRFSIKVPARTTGGAEKSIEVRTSIVPGAFGEGVVLRILNPDAISVPLEKLGMEKRLLAVLGEMLKKPNGMILTTGPTGSGKTTTLYACLQKVNDPGSKIITIEDPVEYHLPGITQTQVDVKKGYTFFEGLKSALRQDPDIIMVGEVRDPDTAATAIDAALTGHLVFSTLHTNNAAGAIPRLLDLAVNPKVIGPAVNLIMAQRLVRLLCEKCKQEVAPTEEERKIIENITAEIAKLGTVTPRLLTKLWKPVGCPACNKTGYRSRVGVFEAILVDEAVEKIIDRNPSEYEIFAASRSQKIMSMREDGVMKVLTGITDLAELARVVDLS